MGITDCLAKLITMLPSGRNPAQLEVDRVLRRLHDQGFWILAKLRQLSPQPANIDFFDYFENGNLIWPIFTTQEEANEFFVKFIAPEETSKGNMVTCQVFQLKISVLLKNDFSSAKIILDPKLPGEREISQGDLQTLRKILPA